MAAAGGLTDYEKRRVLEVRELINTSSEVSTFATQVSLQAGKKGDARRPLYFATAGPILSMLAKEKYPDKDSMTAKIAAIMLPGILEGPADGVGAIFYNDKHLYVVDGRCTPRKRMCTLQGTLRTNHTSACQSFSAAYTAGMRCPAPMRPSPVRLVWPSRGRSRPCNTPRLAHWPDLGKRWRSQKGRNCAGRKDRWLSWPTYWLRVTRRGHQRGRQLSQSTRLQRHFNCTGACTAVLRRRAGSSPSSRRTWHAR